MDLMSSGGVAFVSDVMLRLYDFFDNDQESGELALELLRPVQVSKVDFLLFKICHKMAALGLSARDVFAMIDSDGGGTIDEDEFVEGIRSSLDLMISTPEIIEVFQAIASGQELTKDKFLARCNFDWYHSVVKSDDYTISKCDYLTLMTSVYEVRDKRDIAELVALYESQGEDPMSPETFKRIIWSLNAKTSKKRIERIWNIGLSLSETKAGLPMDIFVKVMLRYRTGTFAATKFYTPEIETAVEDRKTSALDTKQSSESSLLIGDQEVPAIAKKLGTAMLQKTTGTGKSGGKNK